MILTINKGAYMNTNLNEVKVSSNKVYLGFGLTIFSLFFCRVAFVFYFAILISLIVLFAGIFRTKEESLTSKEIYKFQIFLVAIGIISIILSFFIPYLQTFCSAFFYKTPLNTTINVAQLFDKKVIIIDAIIQLIVSALGVSGFVIALRSLKNDK